ncbi:MAG: C10 family peptidase [Candidatus Amulumruptor sp.]|nr:C10 family peptidase [Candidatus Amulumruptor sp.]
MRVALIFAISNRNQLTTTEWAQRKGFESSIPYEGKRLGCATVAVGQLMKFHRHPSYIAWDEMKDYISTKTTADFLYNLGCQMGIDYSSNNFDRDINSALKALKVYGYSVNSKSHDKYKTLSDVKQGYPVLMFGDRSSFLGINTWNGHAWLCDGVIFGDEQLELRVMTIDYRPTIYSTPDLMVEAYKYNKLVSYTPDRYHFNWGWYGTNNGFFDDSNIAVKGDEGKILNYKHNRKDVFVRPLK